MTNDDWRRAVERRLDTLEHEMETLREQVRLDGLSIANKLTDFAVAIGKLETRITLWAAVATAVPTLAAVCTLIYTGVKGG